MVVNVQAERRIEALDDRDRSGLERPFDRKAPRSPPQPARHRPHEMPEDAPCQGWVERQLEPQSVGYCQHPLPGRDLRQDAVRLALAARPAIS